jgi:hypothetical protein
MRRGLTTMCGRLLSVSMNTLMVNDGEAIANDPFLHPRHLISQQTTPLPQPSSIKVLCRLCHVKFQDQISFRPPPHTNPATHVPSDPPRLASHTNPGTYLALYLNPASSIYLAAAKRRSKTHRNVTASGNNNSNKVRIGTETRVAIPSHSRSYDRAICCHRVDSTGRSMLFREPCTVDG